MIEAPTRRLRSVCGAAIALALVTVALGTRAAAPAGRYTIAAGTVHDNKTGLTWQQAVPSGTYSGESASTSGSAQNYCATLSLNGGGWRLPTLKELMTIVDYSVASPGPAIDTTAFPNTPAALYWSSTPATWAVDFSDGSMVLKGSSGDQNVRCVR